MSAESDIVTPVAKPATQSKPGWWMIVLPIVLMVVGALGIGGTLLYAHQQAVAAPIPGGGAGRMPGGGRPSGFPTDGYTPGAYPSGRYTPGAYPTDGRTPRMRPSDFPTGVGQGQGGGNGGMRPNGGPGGRNASMRLNGWEIGLIAGFGVVFVGGATLLALALVKRRKPGAAGAGRQDLTSSDGSPSGMVVSSS